RARGERVVSRITLTLKAAPALRVDLRGVLPAALAALSVAEIGRVGVTHGNQTIALAELFGVALDSEAAADGADELRLVGDCARVDRIGWKLAAGRVVVDGAAGDYVGACMSGGEVRVHGAAGVLAACEMAGGRLEIDGDVGDHAASTLPGSIDGMRGGTLVVRGRAGDRFADRMRRGTALVFGDVGDFAASRLVAGTVAIGGRAGAHVGFGMRRGSVIFAGAAPTISPTFVPAQGEAPVMWQLLARDLAAHGGPFAGLASRRAQRHLGDLAADGKGELIVVA
ncbi:MAG TPA: formylmethanofuran dehydrogenase subunit C, partial [Burkholderiaceae bacterium]|nr:formylmethanofuran dehydrogenase subunit C [Burkholderiaceae bacterium]